MWMTCLLMDLCSFSARSLSRCFSSLVRLMFCVGGIALQGMFNQTYNIVA